MLYCKDCSKAKKPDGKHVHSHAAVWIFDLC